MTDALKPIVWVPNSTGHDLSGAEKFGEMKVFHEGPVNVFGSEMPDALTRWLNKSKKQDYLLLTGAMLANCVAFSHLMNSHGQVKCLIYHQREKAYRIKTVYQEELNGQSA